MPSCLETDAMLLDGDTVSRAGSHTPALCGSRLEIAGGAYATVDESGEEQTVRVFSKSDALVFEYAPETGKVRVHVPAGDLEFVTSAGDIALRAAGTIRLEARDVDVTARAGIRLRIASVFGKLRSAFSLGRRQLEMSGPEVSLTAARGQFHLGETHHASRRLVSRVGEAKCFVGRLETVAKTVVEKARNVYRTVGELTQLRTRRLRTLVDEDFHLESETAMLRADEDLKIDGERIHLG